MKYSQKKYLVVGISIVLLIILVATVTNSYVQYQYFKKEMSTLVSESMEKFSELTHREQEAVMADYSEAQKASTYKLLEMYEASRSFSAYLVWKWDQP